MAEKMFQKPKVYDPTMAGRVPQVNSKMQQMMLDGLQPNFSSFLF
jgi:hypothetical protein